MEARVSQPLNPTNEPIDTGEKLLAAILAALPEPLETIIRYIHDASPAILIIIGVILFLFAGAVKWLVRVIGAGLFIYGLISLLHLI